MARTSVATFELHEKGVAEVRVIRDAYAMLPSGLSAAVLSRDKDPGYKKCNYYLADPAKDSGQMDLFIIIMLIQENDPWQNGFIIRPFKDLPPFIHPSKIHPKPGR